MNEEHHEEPQSGLLVSMLGYELDTSKIRNRMATHSDAAYS